MASWNWGAVRMGVRSAAVGSAGRSKPAGRSGVRLETSEGVELRREVMFVALRTSVRRASTNTTSD